MAMSVTTAKLLQVFLSNPDAPQYGYDIMRAAGLRSGALYPALARLERHGWIEGSWELVDEAAEGRPARRYYRLTAIGKQEAPAALSAFFANLGIPRPVTLGSY